MSAAEYQSASGFEPTRETGLPTAEILRFQRPIVVRRNIIGSKFARDTYPLILAHPGVHQQEADFILLALETLYVERERIIKS